MARWSVLQKLVHGEKVIIVTTWEAALLLGPDPDFFKERSFSIKKDEKFEDIYELGVLLGQGAFADVYHGTNKKTGLTCAVKKNRPKIDSWKPRIR